MGSLGWRRSYEVSVPSPGPPTGTPLPEPGSAALPLPVPVAFDGEFLMVHRALSHFTESDFHRHLSGQG